jgi:hypothetical protein
VKVMGGLCGRWPNKPSEAFSLLGAQPGIGVSVTNARTAGVKRLPLARIHYFLYFLYFLYYRVLGEEVQVLRIWHTRAAEPTPSCRGAHMTPNPVPPERPTASPLGSRRFARRRPVNRNVRPRRRVTTRRNCSHPNVHSAQSLYRCQCQTQI